MVRNSRETHMQRWSAEVRTAALALRAVSSQPIIFWLKKDGDFKNERF